MRLKQMLSNSVYDIITSNRLDISGTLAKYYYIAHSSIARICHNIIPFRAIVRVNDNGIDSAKDGFVTV
jgi:hypothetical protein